MESSSQQPDEIFLPYEEEMPRVVRVGGLCYEMLVPTDEPPDDLTVDGEFGTCVECEEGISSRTQVSSEAVLASSIIPQESSAESTALYLPCDSSSGVAAVSSAVQQDFSSRAQEVSSAVQDVSSIIPQESSAESTALYLPCDSSSGVAAVSSGITEQDAVSSVAQEESATPNARYTPCDSSAVAEVISSGLQEPVQDVSSAIQEPSAVLNALYGPCDSSAVAEVISSGAIDQDTSSGIVQDVSSVIPQGSSEQTALYIPCDSSSGIVADSSQVQEEVSSAAPGEQSSSPPLPAQDTDVSSAEPELSSQFQGSYSAQLLAAYIPCASSTIPSAALEEPSSRIGDGSSIIPDDGSSIIPDDGSSIIPENGSSSSPPLVVLTPQACEAGVDIEANCTFPASMDVAGFTGTPSSLNGNYVNSGNKYLGVDGTRVYTGPDGSTTVLNLTCIGSQWRADLTFFADWRADNTDPNGCPPTGNYPLDTLGPGGEGAPTLTVN